MTGYIVAVASHGHRTATRKVDETMTGYIVAVASPGHRTAIRKVDELMSFHYPKCHLRVILSDHPLVHPNTKEKSILLQIRYPCELQTVFGGTRCI